MGRGAPSTGEAERAAEGEKHGNLLFLPILIVLVTAVVGTLLYLYTPLHQTGLFERNRETFILLCLGVLLALAVIFAWLRPAPLAPLDEGRRLIDAVGWAAVLPLMLAALGLVLADTGVGRTIGTLLLTVIPDGTVLPAVLAFGLGMALLTILTGNAFAAFPVMATAIGIPLADPGLWRRPGRGRRDRHAGGLLRDADDADGGQLQPGAGRLARAQGPERRDQGADRHRAAAAGGQHPPHLFPGFPMTHHLDAETANRFAEIALGHVTREYPHKLDHVMDGPEDVQGPRALHPIFFGSFDWHSCVHGYWLLLRTRRLFPGSRPRRESRR